MDNNTKETKVKTSKEKFSICLSCPELIPLTKTCKICGCFMWVKTKLKDSKCPIDKW